MPDFNISTEFAKNSIDVTDNYIKFMKLGSDKWPMEAFEVLGVDLESPEVYQNAINYFEDLMDKVEFYAEFEIQ